MCQAKSGVKNFSLYWGGRGGAVPQQKFFFPVWTCVKPNLVSKIFPFTETGYPPQTWDWVPPPPQTWDQVPPPDLDLGPPPDLRPGTPPYLDLGPPVPGPGTPPHLDLGPPLPKVNRQTFPSINITFPRTMYAGGKNSECSYSKDAHLKYNVVWTKLILIHHKLSIVIHTFPLISKNNQLNLNQTEPTDFWTERDKFF